MERTLAWIVAIITLTAFAFWKVSRENRAAEKTNLATAPTPENDEEFETDPEVLQAISSACSFDDLFRIVETYDSYTLSREENDAFFAKASALNLSRNDWRKILETVEGEESLIEEEAKERSK